MRVQPETWNLLVFPVPYVNKMPRDRRRRRHRRTDKVRASATTLPAFKVAIAGRSATFAGLQDIWIHSQTHGTPGLSPFESGIQENLIESFGLSGTLNVL